jgi:hypothetical protein
MAGFLDELETQLVQAAGRPRPQVAQEPAKTRSRRRRGLRLAIVMVGALLAITTIALAASGVILTGSPVHPEESLNPSVGEGVPAPGASKLLAVRVPDPEGGLPWGMRIVRTTRQEVCLQVGRVQNGQLGELGIDGAFHDDGRFHPLPPAALPADVFHGEAPTLTGVGNANTVCQLPGEASANQHVGVDRSDAPNHHASPRPLYELRNIYFGLLGPDAVRISYTSPSGEASQPVLPGLGAYLLVEPTRPGQQIESGGGSLGTFGDLTPSPPLTTITYRIAGTLCERGPSEPPGVIEHLPHPCPSPHYTHTAARSKELHEPIELRLQMSHNLLTAVHVSFTAPFAVTNAGEGYTFFIPSQPCTVAERRHRVTGGSAFQVGHSLARGETVAHEFQPDALFYRYCGSFNAKGKLHIASIPQHSATIEVHYHHAGEPDVIIGRTTITLPSGTLVPAANGTRVTGDVSR